MLSQSQDSKSFTLALKLKHVRLKKKKKEKKASPSDQTLDIFLWAVRLNAHCYNSPNPHPPLLKLLLTSDLVIVSLLHWSGISCTSFPLQRLCLLLGKHVNANSLLVSAFALRTSNSHDLKKKPHFLSLVAWFSSNKKSRFHLARSVGRAGEKFRTCSWTWTSATDNALRWVSHEEATISQRCFLRRNVLQSPDDFFFPPETLDFLHINAPKNFKDFQISFLKSCASWSHSGSEEHLFFYFHLCCTKVVEVHYTGILEWALFLWR